MASTLVVALEKCNAEGDECDEKFDPIEDLKGYQLIYLTNEKHLNKFEEDPSQQYTEVSKLYWQRVTTSLPITYFNQFHFSQITHQTSLFTSIEENSEFFFERKP